MSEAPQGYDYWAFNSDAASLESYQRERDDDSTLSIETLSESHNVAVSRYGLIDFKSFAQAHPEKFFELLSVLRVDLQELFIEYYILDKSQTFLANCRKQIQARAFETIHLVSEAFGAAINLGIDPNTSTLRPILQRAGLERTEYGSLALMIVLYAHWHDYRVIARGCGAPLPAIRKIFRPAVQKLLESKNLDETQLGAYLRSLMHQSSLTNVGIGKRHRARMRRTKHLYFEAPALEQSPLISNGRIDSLGDTPWCMFETAFENKMGEFFPALPPQVKKLFGHRAGQVFAPINKNGELELGYMFARTGSLSLTKSLLKIRGFSEIAAIYNSDDLIKNVITASNEEVQKLIARYCAQKNTGPKIGDFVRILSGKVEGYCGTVTAQNRVTVQFPSGRTFTVKIYPGSAKILNVPKERRAFWGEITCEDPSPQNTSQTIQI